MLEFIALNVYTIATIAGVLAIIGGLFIIGAMIPSSDEDTCITIGACIILVNMAVLGILGINTKGSLEIERKSDRQNCQRNKTPVSSRS